MKKYPVNFLPFGMIPFFVLLSKTLFVILIIIPCLLHRVSANDNIWLNNIFVLDHTQIWVRNYQIVRAAPEDALEAHIAKKAHADGDTRTTSLVEIGPRFVLDPVRIFRGSFGGQTLYMNDEFVSPNEVRAQEQAVKGNVFEERLRQKKRKKTRKAEMEERMPDDPLAGVFS
mmetsp:Transcript_38772/g.116529  ORF Transcript_38772/g.116529 Transcript_38772/m.116529 type:complete len:172 (-) Transcript_38772:146-661(-)